jgi:hypothetical protein
LTLGKISPEDFSLFLGSRFGELTDKHQILSQEILKITGSHPYYTQQLAFMVWEQLVRSGFSTDIVGISADDLVRSHDNDYERLWNTLNRTDMGVLTGMALSSSSPLSDEFSKTYGTGASSTVFSTLQRLARKGMITKEPSGYIIDDPFFKSWIIRRRNA